MLDSYERLQKIDQSLNEFIEFDGDKILKGISYTPLGRLIPKRFMPKQRTDSSKKLEPLLTGDQGSARMYVPDADTQARIAAGARRSQLRLARLKPGDPGYNSRAAENARFQTNMRRGSKIAQGVAGTAALGAGAIVAAPAVAAAAPKVALSTALRFGGGSALRAGAGRAATQTGIRATASRLGSKALGTVRKTALGRLLTGKLAQTVGREAAIYTALSKLGVFGGGGDGGVGGAGEAGADDIGSKKLKPKSMGDLDATSAGRDFEAEYGGASLKKLRGR